MQRRLHEPTAAALFFRCFEVWLTDDGEFTPSSQGGNTGLVGGSVPVHDEIVLSTSRMSQVVSIDALSGVMVCEAGCVLQTLDDQLSQEGLMMPLDLGAKGSCQIGGNVSTNAGGIRFLRYGSLHGSVVGLEVVLADGSVLDVMRTLRKDNTGYDLKQLFIGAEGTLGVVTKAAILCPPRPKACHVSFLACRSFGDVLDVFRRAKSDLGEILSAFEFLDKESLHIYLDKASNAKNPLPDFDGDFYLVIETSGSNSDHDYEKLEAFLGRCIDCGSVATGAVAQDGAQSKDFWRIREGVPEVLASFGAIYKYVRQCFFPLGERSSRLD